MLTAFALLFLAPWGCQAIRAAPATQPAERIDRIEQTQAGIAARVEEMDTRVTGIESDMRFQAADISAVKAVTDVKLNKSIVNDVWPWLLSGLAVVTVLAAAGLVLVYMWIRGHSYLKQKPVYEQRKRHGAGYRTLDSTKPAAVVDEALPSSGQVR